MTWGSHAQNHLFGHATRHANGQNAAPIGGSMRAGAMRALVMRGEAKQ
jgi:hypothetical protein